MFITLLAPKRTRFLWEYWLVDLMPPKIKMIAEVEIVKERRPNNRAPARRTKPKAKGGGQAPGRGRNFSRKKKK